MIDQQPYNTSSGQALGRCSTPSSVVSSRGPATVNSYVAFNLSSEFLCLLLPVHQVHAQQTDLSFNDDEPHLWHSTVARATVCMVITVGTAVGNLLVCIAVGLVRRLQTPSNLLILSLAVSDLLVAVLVMPLAVLYELTGEWTLGQTVCDLWTSLDVMLCTASILNLLAISVDRYLVISRPMSYTVRRTPRHMAAMISGVWAAAALISIPALFGWKAVSAEGQCVISQDVGYQLYATLGAFYIPLTVMLVIYYRIYMVSARLSRSGTVTKASTGQSIKSRRAIRHDSTTSTHHERQNDQFQTAHQQPENVTGDEHIISKPDPSDCIQLNDISTPIATGHLLSVGPLKRSSSGSTPGGSSGGGGGGGSGVVNSFRSSLRVRVKGRLSRTRLSVRSTLLRERKATRTLGVIMGAFIACWLPFFIVALIRPLAGVNQVPDSVGSVFQWLGYANSFLNPLIYARFNRDFRRPFKDILLLRCRGINERVRSERYVEQYGGAGGGFAAAAAAAAGACHVGNGTTAGLQTRV